MTFVAKSALGCRLLARSVWSGIHQLAEIGKAKASSAQLPMGFFPWSEYSQMT